MAKRKAKTATKTGTTKGTSAPSKVDMATLVGTQRAAIEAAGNKHSLAELAVKLLAQHGTDEQKAFTAADIEKKTKDEILAGVVALSLRGQAGKEVHLSELGGWPICWSDDHRAKVAINDLLTTPIAVKADAVTCTKCAKAADLPTPEQSAALAQAEAGGGENPKKAKMVKPAKEAKATAAKGGDAKAPQGKRQLALKENLAVRLKIKDLEVKGTLRPDGTLTAKGSTWASPHEAANELGGKLVNYRIDGFQAWRFEDEKGKWRMLRDHG